jgi:prophage antirepressor-like protein
MNDLQIFKNEQFGTVRTVTVNNEPWFVGKDVADDLGYQNGSRDINRHVDEDDRKKIMLSDGTQDKETIVINESGLYSLIFGSKLPTAKQFKHWITAEVIPSIRKTGSYSVKQERTNPRKDREAEAKLNNSRARLSSLWLKIADHIQAPEYKGICASYASAALAGHEVLPLPDCTEHLYTAAEVGEFLGGISGNQVGRIANQNHMKTNEYGKSVWDKSPYSNKQVETFRYNDAAVERFRGLLNKQQSA